MAITIEPGDAGDVDSLRELWLQLHHHHQEVAPQSGEFTDDESSWRVRASEYRQWLDDPRSCLDEVITSTQQYAKRQETFFRSEKDAIWIDVSRPDAPREVGAFDTPGFAWHVAVAGSHAFVADGSAPSPTAERRARSVAGSPP